MELSSIAMLHAADFESSECLMDALGAEELPYERLSIKQPFESYIYRTVRMSLRASAGAGAELCPQIHSNRQSGWLSVWS